jgi:CheY-like chemotaxis protein
MHECTMTSKILLVDNPMESSAAPILLEAGYDVIRASGTPEALRTIRELSLDLIITDMIVDERFGAEVIRQIRRTAPSLPVIVISESETAQQLAQFDLAERLGATAILYRPFSEGELLGIVEQVIEALPQH